MGGIDLREPPGEVQAAAWRAALYAHGLIFLRGQQEMDEPRHRALARIFGDPVLEGPDPPQPDITPVRSTAFRRAGTASTWHVDGCYRPAPPAVSVLRAIDGCTSGGDTCFASGITADAAPTAELRAEIDGLR